MTFHTLRQRQWVPRPIEEVFPFFADARNLEQITPPWLHFRILTPAGTRVEAGTELRYRLRIRGLSVSWTTEIRQWRPPQRFIDVQRKGPYRLWHHTHTFESRDGGTQMSDVVRYTLPFGMLGAIAGKILVHRDVEAIFDYRRARISQLFG